MTRGAFGSDNGQQPSNQSAPNIRDSDPNSRRLLLDQVLQETLSLVSDSEPLRAEDIEALVGLAKRHGTPLTSAAAFELVQCVLAMRQRRIADSKIYFDKLAQELSRTLMDDPPSAERLQRFWERLCEAAQ